MKLQVLGVSCGACEKLTAIVKEIVRELALEDAHIEKVEDYAKIMSYGVMSTPALVIDGKVVLVGRVPSKAEVTTLITTALAEQG